MQEKVDLYLNKNLSQYIGKVNNVILGCTHYPLIRNQIRKVLGDVKFFNGALSLAKHLKEILIDKELINETEEKGIVRFIDSSNSNCKKDRFFNYLSNKKLT